MTGILICIIIYLIYELVQYPRKRKFNNTIYAVKRNMNKMLENVINKNGSLKSKVK